MLKDNRLKKTWVNVSVKMKYEIVTSVHTSLLIFLYHNTYGDTIIPWQLLTVAV